MTRSRRDFLRNSATVAAGLALAPISGKVVAAELPLGGNMRPRVPEKFVKARPVTIDRVRITGGPLKRAQDLTAKYLLELEPDRMMAWYRLRAGLPKKGEPYSGWDGGGRNLTGHIAGHYLSAVSYMYLATGDGRYKERADYLVNELEAVQEANGDGYLGALEGGREAFAALSKGEIRSGGFDLNGLWSPWYTLHKTFAGLRDAYRHTGNRKALDVERKFAEWADRVLVPLDDAQMQRMLNTEHGGMNEVLADLYADTGEQQCLDLSLRFEHHAFTDALHRHQDNLAGKHGNCQIPKLIGSAARYACIGDVNDILAASFFWDRVVQHHSYASGGHGLSEYFGQPDMLSHRVDGRTCESCNDYNMLKLTRRLFAFRPDAEFADFHERALFNHVLASIDPEDGRTSYMVPVGRGVQQEYQNMQQSFTCCVGSGMESHALHGDGIYYETSDTAWVNLFVPSVAKLDNGMTLTMHTGFPDGDTASIDVAMRGDRPYTIAIRRPAWTGDGFVVRVNGEVLAQPSVANLRVGAAGGRETGMEDRTLPVSTYVELERVWRNGDRIELVLPKSLRLEPTPDDPSVTSIMWGPLVLAADHGPRRDGRGEGVSARVPVLVAAERPLAGWMLADTAKAGNFTATGVARVPGSDDAASNVSFAPFHRTHRRTYSTYVDLLTAAEFAARGSVLAAERERFQRLAAATVSFAQPGEMQPERDYNYQSLPADRPAQRTNGRGNRAGAGWFAFDMPVDGAAENALLLTYFNEPGLPAPLADFHILADGVSIAKYRPDQSASGFYDAQYALPRSVTQGKNKVTVKMQAGEKGRILPVYGVRVVRVKAL